MTKLSLTQELSKVLRLRPGNETSGFVRMQPPPRLGHTPVIVRIVSSQRARHKAPAAKIISAYTDRHLDKIVLAERGGFSANNLGQFAVMYVPLASGLRQTYTFGTVASLIGSPTAAGPVVQLENSESILDVPECLDERTKGWLKEDWQSAFLQAWQERLARARLDYWACVCQNRQACFANGQLWSAYEQTLLQTYNFEKVDNQVRVSRKDGELLQNDDFHLIAPTITASEVPTSHIFI